MRNKIFEIGYVEAIQVFSKKDFIDNEKLCDEHHAAKTADERKYFIDLDLEKILVRFYKDSEYVDTHYFNSIKSKFKVIYKKYSERVYNE